MNRDILFKENEFVFSLRAAGVLIHEDRILLQKPKNDDYAFIGGHVSAFETSEEALVREFREEIHADIAVDRLVAMGEIFFPWGNRPCHQIGLYYAVHMKNPAQLPAGAVFHGYDEWDNERVDLDFCWVPLEELKGKRVYPAELIPHLLSDAGSVLHFVSRQLGEETD